MKFHYIVHAFLELLPRTKHYLGMSICITRSGLAVALTLAGSIPALAQEFPHKNIRIMVPFPQGSPGDAVVRVLGRRLAERFRQPFITANRAADGGIAATAQIVEVPPDGYTWLFTSVNHIANIALHPKLPYKVDRDFAPISLIGHIPVVLVAYPATGIKSPSDLTRVANGRRPSLSFGSPGFGTGEHLAMEMFKRAAGIVLVHVPYQGALPTLLAVAEGRSQFTFANITQTIPLIRQARLYPIAVSNSTRSPMLPDTPTLVESGLLNSDMQIWFGLFTRSGVPRTILRRISSEVIAVVREPDTAVSLGAQGMDAIGASPEALDETIRRDLEQLPRLLRGAGIPATSASRKD